MTAISINGVAVLTPRWTQTNGPNFNAAPQENAYETVLRYFK